MRRQFVLTRIHDESGEKLLDVVKQFSGARGQFGAFRRVHQAFQESAHKAPPRSAANRSAQSRTWAAACDANGARSASADASAAARSAAPADSTRRRNDSATTAAA